MEDGASTEGIWQSRIEEWRASGLTGREFSRRSGFAESTLSHWVRKLAAKSKPTTSMSLARVETTGASPDAALEIAVGREVVVRVRRGFDDETLRAVVRALTGDGLMLPLIASVATYTVASTTVYTAPMPDEMIPGGIAGPGFLAHVIAQRFLMHLPYHRQEQQLAHEGAYE